MFGSYFENENFKTFYCVIFTKSCIHQYFCMDNGLMHPPHPHPVSLYCHLTLLCSLWLVLQPLEGFVTVNQRHWLHSNMGWDVLSQEILSIKHVMHQFMVEESWFWSRKIQNSVDRWQFKISISKIFPFTSSKHIMHICVLREVQNKVVIFCPAVHYVIALLIW